MAATRRRRGLRLRLVGSARPTAIRRLEFCRPSPFFSLLRLRYCPRCALSTPAPAKLIRSQCNLPLSQICAPLCWEVRAIPIMFKFEINTRRLINGMLSFLALAAMIALFFAYRSHAQSLHSAQCCPLSLAHLPYYAFCSFYRMLAAVHHRAGFFDHLRLAGRARPPLRAHHDSRRSTSRNRCRWSAFFPPPIYFFVALAHGSRLGVEMAAIFLIFTSQAWNMALGVYEAVKTIPEDSIEALDAFGVRGWLRFKRLLLPASVPKLVYNSILSWVAGWYFLIACEIITVGPANYRLPGLGSFLMERPTSGAHRRSGRRPAHAAGDHRRDGRASYGSRCRLGRKSSATSSRRPPTDCAIARDVRRAAARSAPPSRARCACILMPADARDRPRDRGVAERPAACVRAEQVAAGARRIADADRSAAIVILLAVGARRRPRRAGQDACHSRGRPRQADPRGDGGFDHCA